MKFKQLILLFSIVLLSCGKNRYEKELLGNWYSLNEKFKLEFYKDSLFISDIQNQKTLWNSNESKINYVYKFFLSEKIEKISLKYSLNKTKDSLNLIPKKETLKSQTFMRSKSYVDFLNKKNNINFSLSENQNANNFENSTHFGIKIFIGYVNQVLTIKTEYSPDLRNLENDYKKHFLKYENELKYDYENNFVKSRMNFKEFVRKFTHYCVFADKSISQETINKHIDILKGSRIKTVYQIFNTVELHRSGIARYNHFTNLKGIKK